ncbi:hypothetical protein ACFQS2_13435 [Brachybacterium sp. GCM10030267]|uniref:hypothetical protein n=1 Tax=Brachybacterium sp. GCM10030267 TaxID=3273381 RepID=UPI0036113EAA
MSQASAMALLSIPPVRGLVSVVALLVTVTLPFQPDLGIASRIGLALVLLLLSAVPWAVTLRGFLQDVQEPRRVGGAVMIAQRPRRLAIVVSWIALAVLVVAIVVLGVLVGVGTEGPSAGLMAAGSVLAAVFGLAVSSLLPRLSRWYADGAGIVAVSPEGLAVVPDHGGDATTSPWDRVGLVLGESRAVSSLPPDVGAGLGKRVRWRPGAHAAVRRWTQEGFAPTAAEVRGLGLDPEWSQDPESGVAPRAGQWVHIALMSWATAVCGLLGGAMIVAVLLGNAPWWVLVLLAWAPVLGFVILVPRLWRLLRTVGRRSARVTSEGWIDVLHGQGLVPWKHIERIEVGGRHTLVVARIDAPKFRDRDLGNRLNHRVTRAMENWPIRIPSAGPLFRETDPRYLPYPPETRAFTLVDDAERVGGVNVRRRP